MSATVAPATAPRPSERVERAFATIEACDRPEVWITLADPDVALAQAAAVERRQAAGAELPLAGVTLAVKDNIDVAGLPTTAACPAFAYTPAADAATVARLRAAGAIVLGKTNLDQFATGLVGTRSPYGAVRDARDPSRVAGGSSSGSAVAVALGQVDLALGTDTAGSGRVPAAFQGIVGLKPTRALISTAGVVPACASFDCISVFAGSVADAERAVAVMAEREPPPDAPLAAPPAPRIAVAAPDALAPLSPAARSAYAAAIERLHAIGGTPDVIGLEPFIAAGALLYDGAFVAERYAAVGSFIAEHRAEVDPHVAEIILAGREISAQRYLDDAARLAALRSAALRSLHRFDALLLPTAPFQPTLADVAAAPLELNAAIGRYATFCNLFGLCAIALPAGTADRGCFGVTLFASAFHDATIVDIARRMAAEEPSPAAPSGSVALLVLGAHLRGQPLNSQLTDRGARFLRPARTAREYRLFALDTAPPKPGLVRTASRAAAAIEGELWSLPPAGLASLLAELPAPMALGPVTLEDGASVVGFLCEPAALGQATEITGYGGWRAYLGRPR